MLNSTYGLPPAYMGFVGFVRLSEADGNFISEHNRDIIVRANSADIKLKQDITLEDVIDSRYDKTVYRLGNREVSGGLSFPAIMDTTSGNATITELLYRYAVTRDSNSGLLSPINIEIKYASDGVDNEARFIYRNCIVDQWKLTVNQGDAIKCDTQIIGIDRERYNPDIPGRALWDNGWEDSIEQGGVSTARAATWADARIEINIDGQIIGGQNVRSYEVSVENASDRFYTLNQSLAPQAIAPKKRDIKGNVKIMGRNTILADWAENNQTRCNEESYILFGIEPEGGATCIGKAFNVKVPNVVFQIEDMALTNDLFETTVNWMALPSAGTGVNDPLTMNIGTYSFNQFNIQE